MIVNDLKIDRIISKPLACGINLLNQNKKNKNFFLINIDKETSFISLFEESSLVFTKIFPFGTNSIINDISKLCSLNENDVRSIIKKIDFKNTTNNKNYIDQNLFKESKFKKLSIQHIKEIINARVIEILDHLFNKNKNLKYANKKVLRIDIFFEDKEILDFLGSTFYENLKVDNLETEIKLIAIRRFFCSLRRC